MTYSSIMTPSFFYPFILIIVYNNIDIICDSLTGSNEEDFDSDGVHGSEYEFKIEVLAGTEECFYQRIVPGTKIHVSFEVLHGGDSNIDVYFKDPNHTMIDSHMWKSNGGIEHDIHQEGTYSICLDNSFGHYADKLVYLYIVTFIPEQWEKYVNEISDVHDLAENYTILLTDVQKSISEMKKFQTQSRFSVVKDWYLIKSNNSYVQVWSILQCSVIISTSLLTVYFVRRLFNISNVTPTSKPRA